MAQRGKAIIILNPAEPPLMMRGTVFALVAAPDETVHGSRPVAVAVSGFSSFWLGGSLALG